MEPADGRNLKREWWLSGGILVGTLAIAAAGLYLMSNDIAAQSAKIASDRESIASQTAILSDFASLKSDAVKAQPYTAAMEQLLPTHDALIGFQGWITGVGTVHNVNISVSFTGSNTAATGGAPGSDDFSLQAAGNLSDILAFIDEIETKSQQYLVNFGSFQLAYQNSNYVFTAQGQVFSRAGGTK